MIVSMSVCQQQAAQLPLVNFTGGLNMDSFNPRHHKEKVVVVMGATGTGKSRLAIDLARQFGGEVVNSDKIQVYEGLDIVTNKVTEEECHGVPHHLLGFVDPNINYTSSDFKLHASLTMDSIISRDRLPIIAGGSNSFIEALVDHEMKFSRRYEFCLVWVDVMLPVLRSFIQARVDKMVDMGLVNEVREFFNPSGDYSIGLRRAIGVPEMDRFLRAELQSVNEETLVIFLEQAVNKIKSNTFKLACKQIQKIDRLKRLWRGKNYVYKLDATQVFLRSGKEANKAWDELVVGPSTSIVEQFLRGGEHITTFSPPSPTLSSAINSQTIIFTR
ncbi:hypothetical protein RJ641_004123 [Dillenia turbinata]|uniref:adenylate dimethylallyltransferase (ADP/ATP-dependent) n=1 Tax=Dillenia turbinata TaxID=194707 RepID=A0AAN8Z7Y6_9MAGN